MSSSININYLRHLPIDNFSLNTIPLAILILGLAEFFLFHVTINWGRKIYHLFSKSSSLKALGAKKNQDFDVIIPNKEIPITSCDDKAVDDESISKEEINIVLQSLGISRHTDQKLELGLDCDDLFNIFEENKPSLDEVKEAFDVFDDNKDGFIDVMELQRIMIVLGLKEGMDIENCKKMINVYDENKDGKIDFDEFVKFMESNDF